MELKSNTKDAKIYEKTKKLLENEKKAMELRKEKMKLLNEMLRSTKPKVRSAVDDVIRRSNQNYSLSPNSPFLGLHVVISGNQESSFE